MLETVLVALTLAGGYTPRANARSATLVGGDAPRECWVVAPDVSFDVDGPAEASLVLVIDAPPKKPKAAPVKATVRVDGKPQVHALRPAAGRLTYATGGKVPSAPTTAVAVRVGAGKHTIAVGLPRGRSGCVLVEGLQPGGASAVATAEPRAPELVPPAAATPASAAPAAAAAPVIAAAPAAASAPPAAPELQEIHAAPAEGGRGAGLTGASTRSELHEAERLRLGAVAGAVLPRSGFSPSFAVGLLAEVPIATLGLPGVVSLGGAGLEPAVHLSACYAPLHRQGDTVVPGRGQARLLQDMLVFPLELGATARLDLGLPVVPRAGVGLAVEVTRSTVKAYSTPAVTSTDWSAGFGARAGIDARLGPGLLVAEVAYREIGTQVGAYGAVAETTQSGFTLQLGYLLRL